MAFKPGYGAYAALGVAASETNLTTYSDNIDFERLLTMLDVTVFSNNSHGRIPSLFDSTFKITCNWDPTAVAAMNTLFSGRTLCNLIVGPDGNTTGHIKYNVSCYLSKVGDKATPAGKVTFDIEVATTGDVTTGTFP